MLMLQKHRVDLRSYGSTGRERALLTRYSDRKDVAYAHPSRHPIQRDARTRVPARNLATSAALRHAHQGVPAPPSEVLYAGRLHVMPR